VRLGCPSCLTCRLDAGGFAVEVDLSDPAAWQYPPMAAAGEEGAQPAARRGAPAPRGAALLQPPQDEADWAALLQLLLRSLLDWRGPPGSDADASTAGQPSAGGGRQTDAWLVPMSRLHLASCGGGGVAAAAGVHAGGLQGGFGTDSALAAADSASAGRGMRSGGSGGGGGVQVSDATVRALCRCISHTAAAVRAWSWSGGKPPGTPHAAGGLRAQAQALRRWGGQGHFPPRTPPACLPQCCLSHLAISRSPAVTPSSLLALAATPPLAASLRVLDLSHNAGLVWGGPGDHCLYVGLLAALPRLRCLDLSFTGEVRSSAVRCGCVVCASWLAGWLAG
jgi:hypothetical protein